MADFAGRASLNKVISEHLERLQRIIEVRRAWIAAQRSAISTPFKLGEAIIRPFLTRWSGLTPFLKDSRPERDTI